MKLAVLTARYTNDLQIDSLRAFLERNNVDELHHEGATRPDKRIHWIAMSLEIPVTLYLTKSTDRKYYNGPHLDSDKEKYTIPLEFKSTPYDKVINNLKYEEQSRLDQAMIEACDTIITVTTEYRDRNTRLGTQRNLCIDLNKRHLIIFENGHLFQLISPVDNK